MATGLVSVRHARTLRLPPKLDDTCCSTVPVTYLVDD